MSVQIVIKQIRREAAANKGKAAVLAAVCAVALYFWVPLVAGWFSGAPGAGDPALVVAPNTIATTTYATPALAAPPAAAVAPVAAERHAWYDVAHWMASDPLMTSANLPAGLQDPFRRPAPDAEEPDPDELAKVETPQPPPRLDLKQLGMVLTSTMVGRNRAVIQINGKSLAMPIDAHGRPVTPTMLQHAHGDADYQFAVLKVQPGAVVLQHQSETYDLRLQPRPSAGQDHIQFLWSKN